MKVVARKVICLPCKNGAKATAEGDLAAAKRHHRRCLGCECQHQVGGKVTK